MDEKETIGRSTLQIRCTDEEREQFKTISRAMNKPTGATLAKLMAIYQASRQDGGQLAWLSSAGDEEKAISEAIDTLTHCAYNLSRKASSFKQETVSTKEQMKSELDEMERKYKSLLQSRENTIDELKTEIDRLKGLQTVASNAQKNFTLVQAIASELKKENEKLKDDQESMVEKVATLERQVSELKGRLSVYETLEGNGMLKRK
ncbi:hypothetical protein [uncultured Dialister sp.]|uniref:hypothetical protein n=1 Tax=uncultured Dialister sp. TaxID=278064 RepID=UPI0025D9F2FA|nr:hypothetical protein [uncultured Dialister sp.]